MKDEFDAIEEAYHQREAEIRAQVQALHDESRAIFKQYDEARNALFNKAYQSVKPEIQAIEDSRGDYKTEREVIEALAIAEYSKRLAKTSKGVA